MRKKAAIFYALVGATTTLLLLGWYALLFWMIDLAS